MGRTTERIQTGLLGSDIIEHLKRRQQAEECERDFWRRHSLWKHIENHIMGWDEGFKNKCYLLNNYLKHGKPVCWSHSTGITLNKVELYGQPNNPYLSFQFSVVYYKNDEERDCSDEYADTLKLSERLSVPCDLALNFTEKKWKTWVNEKKKEQEDYRRKEQKSKLEKLLKDTPKDVIDEVLGTKASG